MHWVLFIPRRVEQLVSGVFVFWFQLPDSGPPCGCEIRQLIPIVFYLLACWVVQGMTSHFEYGHEVSSHAVYDNNSVPFM